MHSVKLNHWYIDDSELSISLMNFYVDIEPLLDNNNIIVYLLRVVNLNTEIKEISFKFDSLEEAMSFAENDVKKCFTFSDVLDHYKKINSEDNKVLKKKK